MRTRSIILSLVLLGGIACTKERFDVPSPEVPLQEEGVPISVGLSDLFAEVETRSMDDNTVDSLRAKGFRCTCLKGTYDAVSGGYRYSPVFSNAVMTYNSSDQRFYPPETYYYPAASDGAGHNTVMVFGASYPFDVLTSFSGNDGYLLSSRGDFHVLGNWEGRGCTSSYSNGTFDCTVPSGLSVAPQFITNMNNIPVGHKLVGVAEIKCLNSFSYNWSFYLGKNVQGNSVAVTYDPSWKWYTVEWTVDANEALYFEPFMPDWGVSSTPLIRFRMRNAGVYDLTAIYGAGHEPSAEQFLKSIGSSSFTMYSDVALTSPSSQSRKRPVQIIPNRTFTTEAGIMNWSPASCTASYDADNGYAAVTSTSTFGFYAATTGTQRVNGHIYLGSVEVKMPSQPSGSSAEVFLGDNTSCDWAVIAPSTSFRRYTLRWTANSSSDPLYFEVFRYSRPAGAAQFTAYVRNAFLVDLTATFGAGHEPTAEEFLRDYPGAWYDYNTSAATVNVTGFSNAQDYLAAEARGSVSSFASSNPSLQFNHVYARLRLNVRSNSDVYTVRLKSIKYYRFTGGTFYHFRDASGATPSIFDHMEVSGLTETTIYNNPDGLILSTLGVDPLGYIPLVSMWGQYEDYNKLTFSWSVANSGSANNYTKTISIGGSLTPYQAGKTYKYSLTLGGQATVPSIDIDIGGDGDDPSVDVGF